MALLIDADIRKPQFKANNKSRIGLSDILTNNEDIDQNIHKTRFENLSILGSGSRIPNPTTAFSKTRFKEIIAHLKAKYDIVIIDCPPVLRMADSPIVGNVADASLLVIEVGKIRVPNIKSMIERLELTGTNLIGIVVTKYKGNEELVNHFLYGKFSSDEEMKKNKFDLF